MASRASFLSKAYSAARKAGLSDAAARVAASQAALESNYGKSAPGNNFFGIKAGRSWKGATQNLKTWEVVNGQKVSIKDTFRKYDDFKQSFQDWAKLVGKNWPEVLTAETFEEAVAALNAGMPGGYATDPNYAAKLGFINGRIGDALAFSLPDEMDVPRSLAQTQAIETAYADPMRALDVLGMNQSPARLAEQYAQYQPGLAPRAPAMPGGLAPSPQMPAGLSRPAPPSRPALQAPSMPVGLSRPAPISRPAPPSSFPSRPTAPTVGAMPAARQPDNATLAAAYGQYADTRNQAAQAQALAEQYAQYQPSSVTQMPTVATPPSVPVGALPAAKPPAAIPTAPVAPAPVLAPALAPPRTVADRPVAPMAPAPPAPTAYDVYSGMATQAKDNTGQNTVGMLPDGTSTVTNQWGVTTGMTPYGKQTAVGNLPSIPGISGPVDRTLGKAALPAVGGLLGGPLGGIIGALASYGLSRPGGILSGIRNVDSRFGAIPAYRVDRSLNQFPGAPSGGIRSATFSNRSAEGMRGISPRAAADIAAGRGGLF